jgi:hypothetical protein
VALEAGRRFLTIDEFARVPQLLNHLGVATDRASVQLETTGNRAIMRVLQNTTEQDMEEPWAASLTAIARVKRAMRAVEWGRLVGAPALEARRKEAMLAAYTGAGGDFEQKVARRLRLDPLVVALVAHETWGRSLTEERDRRVAAQAPSDTPRRALQALRAHASRTLIQELTPRLTEAKHRLRKKGGP